MYMKLKCFAILLLTLNFSFSQKADKVLLTVGEEPIMASEFLRVYNKNLDLVKDESQKDIDGYLKLFIEYQLKLKEAQRLGLDEDPKYQREFLNYKNQLTRNYLSENKVTDALVKEAYERGNLDIKASHILVRLEETAKDTAEAYNKLIALKKRVQKEGFDRVKADAHDGKKVFLEDLGYFSAFKMVYDFETAAYNTPVGEISEPFRTQFGYHVVKVDDKRPSRGTITAAHIMVKLNQEDSLFNPEERINNIYKKWQQGENFEALAKQFSDDKSSASKGGQLSPFKSGQLSSVKFENKAFALKNNDEVSKPFKTEYGWHIVKRIDLQPVKSFEDLKPKLESKVRRDSRSKLINSAMVNELKQRYNISYNEKAKAYFANIIDNSFFARAWKLPADFSKEETIFTINDKIYSYYDFGRHLAAAQRSYTNRGLPALDVIEKEYIEFFSKKILKYREDNLELENEDFANILDEYRDGLLLFELMEKQIWNKAAKDTIGLKTYYQKHKANYQWQDRIDVLIASSADKSNANKVLKMMKDGKSESEINTEINRGKQQNVLFTKGIYDLSDNKLPNDFMAKEGVSKIYTHNDAFHVINVKKVLPRGLKTFEEAKGSVINDYQIEIESNWIDALHERFEVEVNKKTLKEIKETINN